MDDCISREAAINGLYKLPCKIDEDGYRWVLSRDVAHMIDEIPAADVVEVVRCKDCRFFHNGYDEKCCINHKGIVKTDENGFCHHAEQKGWLTMDEYIKRGAVLAKAYWHGDSCTQSNPYPDGVEAVDVSAIEQIPAADVTPVRRGRWIPSTIPDLPGYFMCNCCKQAFFNPLATPHGEKYKYCPNCGADMREVTADG